MQTRAITDVHGFARIVVPLDGSPLSETALPLASLLARASGGSIHLVRVHTSIDGSMDMGFSVPNFDRSVREFEQGYIDTAATTLAADTRIPTFGRLVDGAVGRAIREYADRVSATLVVVSSHGHTGLSRVWLGSTADWLVRHLAVPVLVVRPADESVTRPPSLAHVLVCLNGSEGSEQIVPEAVRLGRLGGGRFTLLRVVPTVVRDLAPYAAPTFPPVRDESRTVELKGHAKDRLDEIARALRRDVPGVQVSAEVVASDRIADTVLECARRLGTECIALSTRGLGASRLLIGSVADKVLRGFTGAVLVLGPAAGRDDVRDELAAEQAERLAAH